MADIVAFTGSRRLTPTSVSRILAIIRSLPSDTRVVVGGCEGVDTIAAILARGHGLHVHGVIPADRSRVPDAWRCYVDTFEEMPEGTSYRDRNRRMVDLCTALYAVPAYAEDHPKSRRSGTWMTVRIARSKGRDIHVWG